MGAKSDTPAPDPRLVDAQIRSLDFQENALTRVMDQSERLLPLQEETMRFGLQAQRTAHDQAQEDRGFALTRRGLLSGMQDSLVEDAQAFNTEDRRAQLAAQARGDVSQAFSNTRSQGQRAMSRMGINPNDGRMAAMQAQTDQAQALAKANVSNKVREAARMEGMQMTDRAVNALAGYPAMSSQLSGAAAGYGLQGINGANAGVAGMNSGYGTAGQLAGSMGSNATSMYGTQQNAYTQAQNADAQGTGAAVGAIGTVAAVVI